MGNGGTNYAHSQLTDPQSRIGNANIFNSFGTQKNPGQRHVSETTRDELTDVKEKPQGRSISLQKLRPRPAVSKRDHYRRPGLNMHEQKYNSVPDRAK